MNWLVLENLKGNLSQNVGDWRSYLLTPWSRVLLEKLTGSAASQEIPRIFGTPTFITVLTSARHLFLSWANSIHSPHPPPTSWRSFLILSSHLRLGLPSDLRCVISQKSEDSLIPMPVHGANIVLFY